MGAPAAQQDADAKREIMQLLHDYCEIVDTTASTKDWEKYGPLWTSLFAEDGLFQEGEPMRPRKKDAKGVSSGTKMMKIIAGMFKACSHQITNVNIRMDPKEAKTAWATSKFYVWQKLESGEDDVFDWGDYTDKLVWEDGEWRFAYRHANISGQKGGAKGQLFVSSSPKIEMPKSLSSRL